MNVDRMGIRLLRTLISVFFYNKNPCIRTFNFASRLTGLMYIGYLVVNKKSFRKPLAPQFLIKSYRSLSK